MFNKLASPENPDAQTQAENRVGQQFEDNAEIDDSLYESEELYIGDSPFKNRASGTIVITTHINLFDLMEAVDDFSLFTLENIVSEMFKYDTLYLLEKQEYISRYGSPSFSSPVIKIVDYQDDNIYLKVFVEARA